MAQTRTAGEASRLLAEYERLNRDVPRETRRQMAVFVLAPYVGMKALEALFKCRLGQTPRRHRAWLWYTALRFSDLNHLWDEFVDIHNTTGCTHCALRRVHRKATKTQWTTLSRRLGTPLKPGREILNVNWWKHKPHAPASRIWTPGGSWDRRNNFTKILILGENLDRDHNYNLFSRKLTKLQARAVERELHGLINEDIMLVPQAVRRAVEYVRYRLPQLTGLGYNAGYKTISWFFQTEVPHPDGGWISFTITSNQPILRKENREDFFLDWLPPQNAEATRNTQGETYSLQSRDYRLSPTERLD